MSGINSPVYRDRVINLIQQVNLANAQNKQLHVTKNGDIRLKTSNESRVFALNRAIRGGNWAQSQILKTNQKIVSKFVSELSQYIENKVGKNDQEYAKQKIQSWLQKGSDIDFERASVGQIGLLHSAGGTLLDANLLLEAFEQVDSQIGDKVVRHNIKESQKLDTLAVNILKQDLAIFNTDELIQQSSLLSKRAAELEQALTTLPNQAHTELAELESIQRVFQRFSDRDHQIASTGAYDRESDLQAQLAPLISNQPKYQGLSLATVTNQIEMINHDIGKAQEALPHQLSQLEKMYAGEHEIPFDVDEKINNLKQEIADAQKAQRTNQNALNKILQTIHANEQKKAFTEVNIISNKTDIL